MRRPLRPVRVRAAAIVLALLAHVLVLLLFSFGNRRSSPEELVLQYVSIWMPDQPPSARAPEPPRVPQPQPLPRQSRAPIPAPQSAPEVIAPDVPPESGTPPPESSPPAIDWYGEAAKAAARSASKGDQPEAFSPPPKPLRGPCKPRKHSFEWNPEPKKAGLLPLPYVRVGGCIFMLGFFSCTSEPPPNGHLFDDLQKGDRPVSSVPDPEICE
jgi:hypothetical protein